MANTPVDRVFADYQVASTLVKEKGDISLLSAVEDLFRKALLLSAASWFEYQIISQIIEVVSEFSGKSSPVISFVKNKALERQFSKFFNWDGRNANQFFGAFGSGFAEAMKKKVETSPTLESAVVAFLSIGRDRNRMVHENYASFVLERTTEEVYKLYQEASEFIETFGGCLMEYCRSESRSHGAPDSPGA